MTAINAALQSFNAACPNPNTATLEQLETLVSTIREESTQESSIGNFEYIQAAHACVLSTMDEASEVRERDPDGWRRLRARVLSDEGHLEYRKAALLVSTLDGAAMDGDTLKAFKVCADFAVMRYREVAEIHRAMGDRDLLAHALKVLGEACLLVPARASEAAPALEEARALFEAMGGDRAADVGAIEGHLSKLAVAPPPPPVREAKASPSKKKANKKKKAGKRGVGKEPRDAVDEEAAGAKFLGERDFVVVLVGDADVGEGQWDMAIVQVTEATPSAPPSPADSFAVGGAVKPPLGLAERAADASVYVLVLHRPKRATPGNWHVLAHAGHRVTVAQLAAQALAEPVRSGCSEPEHPVCFGVGEKRPGQRFVQFASFTFNATVCDLASAEIENSAADDAGEAVWRTLASNPISELCAQDLVANLQEAAKADAAAEAP